MQVLINNKLNYRNIDKKISVLIIEDSISYGLELEMLCKEVGFEVKAIVENSAQALESIYADSPDLILMDIDIKGRLNGLDIGKIIAPSEIPILYITSYSDLNSIKKAQQSNLIDFLIKPVSKNKLITTFLNIIENKFNLKSDGDAKIISRNQFTKTLFFQKNGEYVKINIDDVAWVESEDNYCRFHLEDHRKFLMRIKISEVEGNLKTQSFIRCHRSHIINSRMILKIDSKSSTIKLSNNINVPYSRSKKELLFSHMNFLNKK